MSEEERLIKAWYVGEEDGKYSWLGVKSGKSQTLVPLCQWPGCDMIGICESRLCEKEMHLVCKEHRRLFRKVNFSTYDSIRWQPRRKVKLREHLGI